MTPLIRKLTLVYDGWIVGSAADPNNSKPRDWDVVIPYSKWVEAVQVIPQDAKINTFGGFKVTENGLVIDVWPSDIWTFLQNDKLRFLWHPRTGVRFQRTTDRLNNPATDKGNES